MDALSIKPAPDAYADPGRVRAPAKRRQESAEELYSLLRQGDRGALSRSITLVESSRESDQAKAAALLDRTLSVSGRSIRVGITGTPGVGKSTLIETLGMHVVGQGYRLAVLSVDPSSPSTRGSILGDKSRMAQLSVHPNAYIRPSPSGCHLGGVTQQTREAVQLCESARYDVVFVETVGVGQSEIEVRGMVDCFLLLALAGAGDELQGIKRGIMEMADVIALTKADGENRVRAEVAAGQIERALMLLPPDSQGRRASVHLCSALDRSGVAELWDRMRLLIEEDRASGLFSWRRGNQSVRWMEELVHRSLITRLLQREEVAACRSSLSESVREGVKTPRRAAEELMALLHPRVGGVEMGAFYHVLAVDLDTER